ncbi:unnamed protein product, partial [marine sediment metagenome]
VWIPLGTDKQYYLVYGHRVYRVWGLGREDIWAWAVRWAINY